MNIASEPAHPALAQRIAKVRNCMLVEVATGVSVADKNLFVSLCQTYEERSDMTSYLPAEACGSLSHWLLPISNVMQEVTQPLWPISVLSRSVPLWQQGIGFLVTNRADFGGPPEFDDFSDWDPNSA